MSDLLNKKFTLSKKGDDGKFHAIGWIQKSDKYDNLTCSISVEGMKALLEKAQGKYAYCSVFVDEAEKKESAPQTQQEPVTIDSLDSIPF